MSALSYASRRPILMIPLLAALGSPAPASAQGPAPAPSAAPAVVSSQSAPSAVHHRTVSVDGVDLFYREAGPKDAPVILLLHGLPSSSHMFRHLMPLLADRFRVIAPDYPGFGASAVPSLDAYDYSFDRISLTMDQFTEALGLDRYGLYVFDYGAPVGFRMAARQPDRVRALIVQNGNAYEDGMGQLWDPLRAYWKDPTPERASLIAQKLLSLESTKWHYLHGVRDAAAIAPETWILDQALLDRPGMQEIQLRLLYDYGSNPARYPEWHAYFRKHRPPTLIVWGENDGIFQVAGAHAFRRDLPDAEIHLFDTGHFALEEDVRPIAETIRRFMDRIAKP